MRFMPLIQFRFATRLPIILGSLALILLNINAAVADTGTASRKSETLITAKQMKSDQETGIVTATGKVEIARGGYILHADKVTYNQKTGVMHAEGHVAMLTPSGEVEFADREEITGDMKQAYVENLGILFPDNSRFAARSGKRYEGRWMEVEHGMYTACNVCKENPDQPPLWQIRGDKIVHDNIQHEIYYHDATVEFSGTPIFYTPYLSMPDPTVDRRQGFLAPMPGISPIIGSFVRVPYYFDISEDKDAILEPTFSAKDKVQMGGEYRERFENGNLQFVGSFTRANLVSDAGIDEGTQWRGNLVGKTLFNLDDVWRAGTDVDFTSDKSYLQRYRYSSADELVNRAYLEGFQGRDYAVVNNYYFENLRPGTQPVEPLVLPQANFQALGEPGQTLGGRWSFDSGLLVTSRANALQGLDQQGPDTRRLSFKGGWDRRFISDTGLVTEVSGLARLDNYWADNVIDPNGSGTVYNNVTFSRQFEQANIVSSYPMSRGGDGYVQMFEPIMGLTLAPTVRFNPKTPIEDSLDVDFDETNLFSPNRFTGTDLIEGGSRTTYGLRNTITTDNDMRIDVFGGQSYSFNTNSTFPELSGLQDHLSDYVGRIDFVPATWFNLNYGARLSRATLAPQRQDAMVALGDGYFRPTIRYISAYQTETTGIIDQVKEVNLGFTATLKKYWTLSGSQVQAFAPSPGPRSTQLVLSYNDECFIFGVTASRNYTSRADINSGTSVVFHFFLKNIGGVHTDNPTSLNFPAQFRQE